MRLIKLFALWMDMRTPEKRKEQNWNRYFRGHIVSSFGKGETGTPGDQLEWRQCQVMFQNGNFNKGSNRNKANRIK